MEIKRDGYLKKLIAKRDDGKIKVITGLRRAGKSYLLFELYRKYLISEGVDPKRIIGIELDKARNAEFRNPLLLLKKVRELTSEGGHYYLFLDEVTFVVEIKNPALRGTDKYDDRSTFINLYSVLSDLMGPNLDIYVTGSNSHLLSKDVLTEFRDRGEEIRVHPLTFSEFMGAYSGSVSDGWDEYATYGGMPYVMRLPSSEEKTNYLLDLYQNTYTRDILERYSIERPDVLDDAMKLLFSSASSLTSIHRIASTLNSVKQANVQDPLIHNYLDHIVDSFLFSKACRYDIKGKQYFESPYKYYPEDVGLRNAVLNYRELDEDHIMENVLYNELIARGCGVDVGVYESFEKDKNGKTIRKGREIDFVASKDGVTYYLQSAFEMKTEEKREAETVSLRKLGGSFAKIVVQKKLLHPYQDEDGIYYVSLFDFLLDRLPSLPFRISR